MQITVFINCVFYINKRIYTVINYRADRDIRSRRTILAAALRAFSLAALRAGMCIVSVNGCSTEHLHSTMSPASVSHVARRYSSVCVGNTTNMQQLVSSDGQIPHQGSQLEKIIFRTKFFIANFRTISGHFVGFTRFKTQKIHTFC